MNSELYRVIYKITVFCSAATLGLSVGGAFLCCRVCRGAEFTTGQKIAVAVAEGFGILLFAASVCAQFYFRRRCRQEQVTEKESTGKEIAAQETAGILENEMEELRKTDGE